MWGSFSNKTTKNSSPIRQFFSNLVAQGIKKQICLITTVKHTACSRFITDTKQRISTYLNTVLLNHH